MKKRITLLLALSCYLSLFPMDPPLYTRPWVKYAVGILAGAVTFKAFLSYIHSAEEPFALNELPRDIQLIIIDLLTHNSNAKDLDEAVKTINALTKVNKDLNALINDSQYCLQIIKHLSERFNCSNEEAALKLGTQAAKERLQLQLVFKPTTVFHDIINITESRLDGLIAKGIDLDFTYTAQNVFPTALYYAILKSNVGLAILLIQKGANVNQQELHFGFNPLMMCASNIRSAGMINFLKYLIQLPSIQPNRKNKQGQTALNILLTKLFLSGDMPMSLGQAYQIVELFLKAGADPSIADNEGNIPLSWIKQYLPNIVFSQ
jgi:hypothetical protein